jgi:hypothetical protein
MADAPDPITSPPSMVPGGYDATASVTLSGWVKTSDSVPGGSEDQWATRFPDDGGPWKQT